MKGTMTVKEFHEAVIPVKWDDLMAAINKMEEAKQIIVSRWEHELEDDVRNKMYSDAAESANMIKGADRVTFEMIRTLRELFIEKVEEQEAH